MRKTVPIVFKYFYSFGMILLVGLFNDKWLYSLVGLIELVLIFLITQNLFLVSNSLAQVFNYIFLLLLNIQLTVLYFSGTWLNLAMVDNLDSLQDLSGKFGAYLPFVVLLLICTCIPSKHINLSVKRTGCICVMLFFMESLIAGIRMSEASPVYSMICLAEQYVRQEKTKNVVRGGTLSDEFYKAGIEDFTQKPDELIDSPNVILILTEGLSQSIISDERDIMPNVRRMQSESINFENYYNHTFATYNGISGQLYSGFQCEKDEKNLLISLQDILKNEGYTTSFINVEPFNNQFVEYLANLEFDNLITDEELATDLTDCISDKNAYHILTDVCEEYALSKTPFFVTMYTVGTHVGWVCPDEKFADGSDEILNKFYNSDYQFGLFMDELNASGLADNTIIIYTTDHATYAESDYTKTFPDVKREHSSIDKIPLFIWYRGVEPESIDVNGRNSLDLAPTICDFLDISQSNYFLGTSLFGQDTDNEYDTIHSEALSNTYSTENAKIHLLEDEKLDRFQEKIIQYFSTKIYEDKVPFMKTEISDDYTSIKIMLENADKYEHVWFPVWTEKRNQEDIKWYDGVKNPDGIWECEVNLCEYYAIGNYYIDAYTGEEAPEEHISSYSRYIDQYPDIPVRTEIFTDSISRYMQISYASEADYQNLWFVVWSEKDGQDDIKYYLGEKRDSNYWEYKADLADHFNDTGKYNISVFAGTDIPEEFIIQTVVWTD